MAQGDITFSVYLTEPGAPGELPYILSRLYDAFGQDVTKMDAFLKEATEYLGVTAEEFGIVYPVQPEPRTPKPRYSERTGKQLKPRKPKRYVRTGRLGASQTSRSEPAGAGVWFAIVGTDVKYAPRVVGRPAPVDNPGQAWFHQGVWTPLADNITAHIADLRAVLVRLVKDKLKSLGKTV